MCRLRDLPVEVIKPLDDEQSFASRYVVTKTDLLQVERSQVGMAAHFTEKFRRHPDPALGHAAARVFHVPPIADHTRLSVHVQILQRSDHFGQHLSFQAYRKVWDMAEFDMNSTDPNAFKDNRTMLSMRQLRERADSLYGQAEAGRAEIFNDVMRGLVVPKVVKSDQQTAIEKHEARPENTIKIQSENNVPQSSNSVDPMTGLPAKPVQNMEKTTAQKRIAPPTVSQKITAPSNGPPPDVGSLTSGGGSFVAQKKRQLDSLKNARIIENRARLFPKKEVKMRFAWVKNAKTIQPPISSKSQIHMPFYIS